MNQAWPKSQLKPQETKEQQTDSCALQQDCVSLRIFNVTLRAAEIPARFQMTKNHQKTMENLRSNPPKIGSQRPTKLAKRLTKSANTQRLSSPDDEHHISWIFFALAQYRRQDLLILPVGERAREFGDFLQFCGTFRGFFKGFLRFCFWALKVF